MSQKMHLNGLRLKDLERHDMTVTPTTSLKVGHSSCPSAAPACPDSLVHPTQTNQAGPSHPHRCGDIPLPRIHTWTACKPSGSKETKVGHCQVVWTHTVELLSGEQLSFPHWQKKNRSPHLLIECWALERLQNVALAFPSPCSTILAYENSRYRTSFLFLGQKTKSTRKHSQQVLQNFSV